MSLALLIGATAATISVDWMKLPELLTLPVVLVSITAMIILTILTYKRLKGAGLAASSWICLMILTINFGPELVTTAHYRLTLGGLVALLPIAIGWFAGERQPNEIDPQVP